MREHKQKTIFNSKFTALIIILITILLCGTIISHASSNTKEITDSSNTKGWVGLFKTKRQ